MTIWNIIGDISCLSILFLIGWNMLGIAATIRAWWWLYDHGNHVGTPTLILIGKIGILIGLLVWLEYDHMLLNSMQTIG